MKRTNKGGGEKGILHDTDFHEKPFLRKKSFTNNFFTFGKNLD
jgi:hypothetical protein